MIPHVILRGGLMKRFVSGADRGQSTLLPECLDDFIDESNPVRVIDAFVDALDLAELGFDGVEPAATGRPSYHPSIHLKLYIYGYLNRVQSGRRLEREAGRNVEVMWLLGRLVPDHKDDRRLPQGQRRRLPQGVRTLRGALPPDGPADDTFGDLRRLDVLALLVERDSLLIEGIGLGSTLRQRRLHTHRQAHH